ncbi:DUF4085 family protein [Clostridium chromiireducens]|uniref:DUF4085 family protein n=1 Tax=Clostridium chromiireducens TaxID=225345 RepID=A0A1V4II61_9CLOT|nr:DUF4085 family protein [Clostridium chromiireducens]OPJ59616.1 hypothetical protein CLCHR_33910 [Clostridium chromiireducens]
MMYFTRNIYKKMQIRGEFPLRVDDKDKWMKQWEEFYNLCHAKKDKEFKAWVFQHIPEVKDDILQGKKFTDKEVVEKLYKRMKEMAYEWKTVCKMCQAEHEEIKHKLPLNMQTLINLNLHDSIVLAIKKDSNNMLNIELDRYSLTFKDVSRLEITDDIVGDSLLYKEVHLSDMGKFDFQVLFCSSQVVLTLHEFRVIADDVVIESKTW